MDKTTMLKAIKQIVTKSANFAVHSMNFGNLMQHENEPMKDFLIQLHYMALDCEFICLACSHDLGGRTQCGREGCKIRFKSFGRMQVN